MPITSARYTNPEQTIGVITENGVEHAGPIPPNAGDVNARFQAWLTRGGKIAPYTMDEDPIVPIEPPLSVTASQAKRMLLRVGLLDDVEALIVNYPREIQIWYREANDWEIDNPYIMGLGLELGLTDDQVAELFIAASKL